MPATAAKGLKGNVLQSPRGGVVLSIILMKHGGGAAVIALD